MKSKFAKKQHKKYKPSHKHIDNQIDLDLNEQQKACNLLKQQSYFAFDDVNNQQQNIFLKISPRQANVISQMKIRHTEKVNHNSNKSTIEKSPMSLTNIRNTTLPNVKRHNNKSNNRFPIKQHSSWLPSPSKSPVGKLPINLTQYVIVDSRNSPICPSVSFSATFLHQKYTKAIQQILKQRQIEKIKETSNMSNYSQSNNSPTKRNRSLNLKRTNKYLNNFIIN